MTLNAQFILKCKLSERHAWRTYVVAFAAVADDELEWSR